MKYRLFKLKSFEIDGEFHDLLTSVSKKEKILSNSPYLYNVPAIFNSKQSAVDFINSNPDTYYLLEMHKT